LVAGRPAVDGEAAEQDAIGTSGAAPPGRVRDVVVVGGGIGGLVVASLLASAGRAVSLVEASDALGGDCRGLVQDGHRYDLGVSLLSGTGAGGVVGVLCDRLGLNLPVVACDPALQVALPRHRLDLPSGADGWWSEIRREFPEEEEVWHALVADLGALARDRDELVRHLSSWPPGGWLERFRYWRTLARRTWAGGTRQGSRQLRTAAGTPFQKTLTEYGFGAAGRQVLEACLWYALARGVDECSTLEAAVALQRLRDGVESPAGGPGALAELLAQRLRERGGDIRLQTGVARFLTERGRMIGVTTAAGETILARSVVTALAPGLGAGDVAYVTRGWMGWRGSIREPWHPHRVAELLGVTIPEAVVPSALGRHCLVVGDAGQPARDENLVFVRRTSGGRGAESRDGMARLTVGRFVPSTGSNDRRTAPQALWEALDRVIPGVARDVTHQVYLPPSAVGALWGRGAAAVRYTVETSGWLGRRGLRHETGWPNLHMVGPWTYPGRSVADVVEGAMHVADKLIGSARDGAR
jgi:phytoene dehydrogenase-like protein